jgi:hypothetical protein
MNIFQSPTLMNLFQSSTLMFQLPALKSAALFSSHHEKEKNSTPSALAQSSMFRCTRQLCADPA